MTTPRKRKRQIVNNSSEGTFDDVIVNGDLSVIGDTNMQGTCSIGGVLTCTALVQAQASLDVVGTLDINGLVTSDGISNDGVIATTTLTSTGLITAEGNLNVEVDLDVDGATTTDGITNDGTLINTGLITSQASINNTGTIVSTSNISITGSEGEFISDVKRSNPLATEPTGAVQGRSYFDDGTNTASGFAGFRGSFNNIPDFYDMPFYHSGAWVPEIAGTAIFTMVLQQGLFVRIGNMVTLTAHMSWSDKNGATGAIRLDGSPFTKDDSLARTVGYIGASNGLTVTGSLNFLGLRIASGANFNFIQFGLSALANLTETAFSGNGEVTMSATFMTDDSWPE